MPRLRTRCDLAIIKIYRLQAFVPFHYMFSYE
jgi:hypothetical protein